MEESPDINGPGDRSVWDEYRWESFIRQQDARTDEYMALLEYYGEDPDSHNIIARSMGWMHLVTNCQDEPNPAHCQQCPEQRRADCQFHDAYFNRPETVSPMEDLPPGCCLDEDPDEDNLALQAQWHARYTQHPVHDLARQLVSRLNRLCRRLPEGRPAAQGPLARLLHYAHCCLGKIAASLDGYSEPEVLGMVVAYLKIAFHAASVSLGQLGPCLLAGEIAPADAKDISVRLLAIRAQLAGLIEEFRDQLASKLDEEDGTQ